MTLTSGNFCFGIICVWRASHKKEPKMSNAVSWRIAGERYKSSAMVRARSHRLG
jgi:hypothetical protein